MSQSSNLQRQRHRLLTNVPKEFSDALPGIEKRYWNALYELILRLDTQAGRFVFSQENILKVNEISTILSQAINNSSYSSEVSTLMRSFSQIAEVSNDFYRINYGVSLTPATVTALQEVAISQVTTNLLSSGMITEVVNPVTSMLQNYVTSGEGVTKALEVLGDFIKGNEEKLGAFQRYVPQVAYDAINQFDGSVQQKIIKDFGFNAITYEGSIIEGSRPQCRRWVEMGTIKISDFQKEIDWALKNGSGMNLDTTPETFVLYRGGYRCRHSVTATRIKE